MARFLIYPAILSLACLAQPALADSCDTPQQINTMTRLNSLDLEPLPDSSRMLVPITIDGAPKKFLLGTAGGLITLNDRTVQAMNLSVKGADSRVLDSAGYASNRFVRITDFRMGNMHSGKADLMITPDRKAGTDAPYDGILAAGLRYHYDLEMDFAARKLNYFSADHCDGHVVYWPAKEIGVVPIMVRRRLDDSTRRGELIRNPIVLMSGDDIGAGSIDTASQGGGGVSMSDPFFFASYDGIAGADIQVTVVLDGTEFRANIDTNLDYSTLNSTAARAAFSVREDSPGSAPAASLIENDPDRKQTGPVSETVNVFGAHTFAHTFHSLAFGGVTVINPHFLVRPDRTGYHDPLNTGITGSRIGSMDNDVLPDISIGMDVLKHLHLYFAFQERKLYVTAAAPQAQAALGK